MAQSPLEIEKERLAVAVKRIDSNLAALAEARKHFAAHFHGPAADRLQTHLRIREKQLLGLQQDLRRLSARADAAFVPAPIAPQGV